MSVHVQTWLNSNNDKVGHWYTNEVITSRVGQFTWAIIAVTHFCCVSHETTGHSTNSKCKRPRRERNATTTERRKQFVELGELGIPTTEHRKELKVVESKCSPWRPLISFSTKNQRVTITRSHHGMSMGCVLASSVIVYYYLLHALCWSTLWWQRSTQKLTSTVCWLYYYPTLVCGIYNF